MKLVSVAEMQAIEREANAQGFSYEMMMENAGRNLAEVVQETYGFLAEDGAGGLVGSGNNGGDTLVALTYLAQQGWPVSAYLVRPRPVDDILIQRFLEAGGQLYWAEDDPSGQQLNRLLTEHAILLDGILGTGIKLPLKTELAQLMDKITKSIASLEDAPAVVAVDVPSGIDCDNGEAAPECIPAELTVTMAAVKQGMLKFPAYELVGDFKVVDIGLPDEGENLDSFKSIRRSVADPQWVRDQLPSRPLTAHKGSFGTALVVAGSVNYTGAAWLAGQAAYRIGAGLVTLAVPAPLHSALAGQFAEATWLPLPDENGFISSEAAEIVQKNLERASALLIGPGFGLEKTTGDFLSRLLRNSGLTHQGRIGFAPIVAEIKPTGVKQLPPLVIDADGLKHLAKIPAWHTLLPSPAILTPHPGEMSVLTGLSKEEIQGERETIAERYSRTWGHVVVLKGAMTVVAAPDGQLAIIPVATPALARAGTGDVLAGVITGLCAQGVAAFPAAVAGAWIHAQAGVQAALTLGNTASVLAGDVLKAIPEILNQLL